MGIGMSTRLSTEGTESRADRPDLATRLRELCQGGDREAAASLARSVVCSADDPRVTTDDATVTVETDHFVGTHEWRVDPETGLVVDGEGRYRSTIEGADLSFSTMTISDAAEERAIERLERRVDVGGRDEAGEETDPDRGDDDGEGTDGRRLTQRLKAAIGRVLDR